MLASLDIYFRVSGVEPDPLHPDRPKINIAGEVDGRFNVVGFVKLTDDDQVWWHYVRHFSLAAVMMCNLTDGFSVWGQ